MTKIEDCVCEAKPKLFSKRECHGQGMNLMEHWVGCDCGMRTNSQVAYAVSDKECQEIAIKIWNDHIGRISTACYYA